MLKRRTLRLLVVAVCSFLLCLCTLQAFANITLSGNIHGNPPRAEKPCPQPGCAALKHECASQLNPIDVALLQNPSDPFKTLLQSKYKEADGWHINYMDGNNNMKGTFNVDHYKAYNDCDVPDFLGTEIKVDFAPDADSLIKDCLWVQFVSTNFLGSDQNLIDNLDLLNSMGGPPAGNTCMPGPFYPYQDEDVDPPLPPGALRTNPNYDYFYDKPHQPCPPCGTTLYAHFQTFACWWDDYYKTDGTIVDVGNDGHQLFFHEGFAWGVDSTCVPEPSALLLGIVGMIGVQMRRRA